MFSLFIRFVDSKSKTTIKKHFTSSLSFTYIPLYSVKGKRDTLFDWRSKVERLVFILARLQGDEECLSHSQAPDRQL